MLYEKALRENVPFFKFMSWLESTIQKEMIALMVIRRGSRLPDDMIIDRKPRTKPKTQLP